MNELERFFAAAWAANQNGWSMGHADLQEEFCESGLCEWREATARQAKLFNCEKGDDVCVLTAAGKAALKRGQSKP